MEAIYYFLVSHIEAIKLFFIVIASILAYVQFVSANAFKRSQYLSELWRKFYTNEKFTLIYQSLEREDTEAFKQITEVDIYHYLAYLEEVAIFVKNDVFEFHKINKADVLNLFQYHFYYIYQNDVSKKMFWSKILPINEIEKEINQFYWEKQFKLSIEAKQKIDSNIK